ncbi:MAG: class I SAM-dependent methyltransferase [Candidatus Sulfotelmatobacter sp.]
MKTPLKRLQAAVKDRALRLAGLELKIEYVTSPPSPQNVLDIFEGEWNAKLPPPLEDLKAGDVRVFEDERIAWLGKQLDNPGGLRVLECGPHEAGQTYMLERLGVSSILAIESNTHAFLRCLVLKELLELKRSRFMLGDFVSYLRTSNPFDLVVASGVLYHLLNPVEAIALISNVTDQVYIWSHYYDEEKIKARPILSHHFRSISSAEYNGFKHLLHQQFYQTRLGNAGFNGGAREYSNWLSREGLLGSLKFCGFNDLSIHYDHADDPIGPNISLLARRTK